VPTLQRNYAGTPSFMGARSPCELSSCFTTSWAKEPENRVWRPQEAPSRGHWWFAYKAGLAVTNRCTGQGGSAGLSVEPPARRVARAPPPLFILNPIPH